MLRQDAQPLSWPSTSTRSSTSRFQLLGGDEDLDAAVATLEEATGAAEGDPRLHPLALSGMAAVLSARFRTTGARADIDRAVALADAALAEAASGSPRIPRYRGILSVALAYRYDAFGAIDDLQQAIALRITGARDVDPGDRAELGTLLRRRWLALRDRRDLDQSIDLLRQAARERTPGNRPVHLTNLGNALLERYAETGELEDVRDATDAHEVSIRSTSEGDWQLASRHNNAGNSQLSL